MPAGVQARARAGAPTRRRSISSDSSFTILPIRFVDLEKLADGDMRPQITEFASGFDALSASWTAFYRNFGVNTQAAIMELALRADPLTERTFSRRCRVSGRRIAPAANSSPVDLSPRPS